MNFMKYITIFVIAILSLIGPYKAFINFVPNNAINSIVINNGDSMNDIVKQLIPDSLLNKVLFRTFLKLESIDSFKSGEYEVLNKSLIEIFILFKEGKTITHKLTIQEGSTIYDLQKLLDNSFLINNCYYLDCIDSQYPFKEGILFPNTYFYKKDMLASSILKQSYNKLDLVLSELWSKKPPNNILKDKNEALILASIIEKEAGNDNEKSLIASVFLKRIEIGMRLQADPTIIYGLLPNFDGDIKKSDILDKNNPYNTYMIKSLPPTPIAIPSLTSIEAAVLSTPGEYLFFVANTPTSHYFSKTYDEHLSMIKTLGLNK
ncbi:MAG: endolytic transglycosylase MltG [SAR86 cluster bacterium]|uniref:Endolytic murein transglycosylase n=1 Tax=SAR86 cluster bacterium TaxID=2030880 RepID=A0A520MEW4_9GAMM|nr:MAG: endolytic transglycosylase MltG [SAR86 cluster bacterium]